MDEIEWQNSTDSIQMIEWLGDNISPRKKRLFGCALCHKLEHLLRHKPAYVAIEAAETLADDLLDEHEKWRTYNLAHSSRCQCNPQWTASYYARCAVVCITIPNQPLPLRMVQGNFRQALRIAAEKQNTDVARDAAKNACQTEADLLRDIVGNPFLQDDFSWTLLNNSFAKSKAEFIYANRRFDLLPDLADTLEETGCTSNAVLNHCRCVSEHTLSCWVIDSLLNKR